jgi:hypothetical protein
MFHRFLMHVTIHVKSAKTPEIAGTQHAMETAVLMDHAVRQETSAVKMVADRSTVVLWTKYVAGMEPAVRTDKYAVTEVAVIRAHVKVALMERV